MLTITHARVRAKICARSSGYFPIKYELKTVIFPIKHLPVVVAAEPAVVVRANQALPGAHFCSALAWVFRSNLKYYSVFWTFCLLAIVARGSD